VTTVRSHESPAPTASANFGSRNIAACKESASLWHQRLGHTNMRHLEQLVAHNKIKGINVPRSQIRKFCDHRCEICIMAKHARSPFHSKPQRATRPLQALHCDLCGPYPVPTIGGGYYTQTVLDEHGSYAGGSILKKKSDGPDELKRLILAWEADTGKKVTTLYTDRGGEFINDHLKDWFLTKGIKHIFSTPRTPEENGKAERLNRTINDFVRALLYQYCLYLPLWGHAYLYAIMIYNAMLNKRLGMSRQEAFNGTVPDVSNFRTFGCKVYAKVPETARNKLSPKSQVGIFLGPESRGPGYKVLTYNPELKRDKYQVRIFRDIVCFEDLKSTTGVQESSELHWGGNIPMPRNPEPEAPAPPELESLTGVPEAPVPSAAELAHILKGQVNAHVGTGPEGSSIRSNLKQPLQLMPSLQAQPYLQGHHPPSSCAEPGGGMQTQDLVVNATPGNSNQMAKSAITPSTIPIGEPLPEARPGVQQPSGQVTQDVTPPRDNTTVNNGSNVDSVPVASPVNRNYDSQSRPRDCDHPVQTETPATPVVPKRVLPESSIAASNPIKRVTFPTTSLPTVSPVEASPLPNSHVNPSGTNPFRASTDNPVIKPFDSVRSPYMLRSRTKIHASASLAIDEDEEHLFRPDETPFDASAFLASAPPFPQPKLAKSEVTLPTKDEMVDQLMTHFKVKPPEDGKVYTLADAKGLTAPKTLNEAMRSPFARNWAEAAVEEWMSLQVNDTWNLVDQESWMKVIPCKWVFTVKLNEYGIPNRFKARLVAGGHRQEEGVDYDETYAPVSRHATLRTLFAVAAKRNWTVKQLDITTAFLHGETDMNIYMKQPPGFIDGKTKVIHLNKTLYGLKQSPRVWYNLLSEALRSLGFKPVSADSSFWVKDDTPILVYLTSVVDDMLVTSACIKLTDSIVRAILEKFPGKSLGEARHYNGMKVNWYRDKGYVILSQPAHIMDIVQKFGHMYDFTLPRNVPMKPGLKLCKGGTSDCPTSPPLDTKIHQIRVLHGKVAYIAGCVRPDIAFAANQVSRHIHDPTEALLEVVIDIVRYLVHTKDWGICLGKGSDMGKVAWKFVPDAVAYADANHGTGMDDKRSISGMVLQVYGGPVSWASRVQSVTSASTTESEYRALSEASREALWLAKIIKMFGIQEMPFTIRGDSRGALYAIKNYQYTKHTKHIEIHHDFMRDRYAQGVLDFDYVEGKVNPADVFTKALPRNKFEECRDLLGMREAKE
jgi:transposase InsO family protein